MLYPKIIRRFPWVFFYCVDPGAYRLFVALKKRLPNQRILFFCDGWAKSHSEHFSLSISKLELYLKKYQHKALLLLGSQSCFKDTQTWIRRAAQYHVTSGFVFDHWKNYLNHFYGDDLVLPNYIFVPDEFAKEGFLKSLYTLRGGISQKVRQSIYLLPQYSILDTCDLIQKGLKTTPDKIIFFLDPESESHDNYPGYSPKSILENLKQYVMNHYPGETIVIKPHPRTNKADILNYLRLEWAMMNYEWCDSNDFIELLSQAKEVWGMTSVCLLMAKWSGKPIKSFQFDRNEVGVLQSAPHLEQDTILST